MDKLDSSRKVESHKVERYKKEGFRILTKHFAYIAFNDVTFEN